MIKSTKNFENILEKKFLVFMKFHPLLDNDKDQETFSDNRMI